MIFYGNDKKKGYSSTFLILLVGIVVGIFINKNFFISKIPVPVEVRENSDKFKYINPLIITRVSKDLYSDEFEDLNKSIQGNIDTFENKKYAKSISIYFRDMNTGHWTGINEDKKYHPSSMLKVLGMMSYFKRSEAEKGLLSKRLYYKSVQDYGQNYKPKVVLSPGMYSIDDLIKQMIEYSDNTVLDILDKEDKDNSFNIAYKVFQLPYAKNIDDVDGFMSPRTYSALFRALYNSAYLSNENSEKALDILSKTDFKDGITKDLPTDLKISHKFGEHTYEDEDGKVADRELHDCGIVYYPKDPYLICVMTSGVDFKNLEEVISTISKTVYDYVDNKNKLK